MFYGLKLLQIDPKIKSVGTDLSIDIIWNDPTDPSSDPSTNPNNPTVPFYTVVFYDNGGSGSMDNMICEINKEYTLPECGFFAPYGKKFNGWNIGDVGAKFSNLSSIDKDIIVIVPEWIE